MKYAAPRGMISFLIVVLLLAAMPLMFAGCHPMAPEIKEPPAAGGPLGATEVVGDRRIGRADGGADLAAAQALTEAEAEDLSDLAHGGSGTWHRHRSSNGLIVRATMAEPRALTSAR